MLSLIDGERSGKTWEGGKEEVRGGEERHESDDRALALATCNISRQLVYIYFETWIIK